MADPVNKETGAETIHNDRRAEGPQMVPRQPLSPSEEPVQADRESRRINRVQAIAETVIATAVVLTLLYYARLPMIVLLVSVLLAFILAPIAEGLSHIHVPHALSSLIATLAFVAAIYGLFYVSYNRAESFLDDLPRYSGEIRHLVLHVQQKAEKVQKATEGVLPKKPNQSTPSQPAFDIQKIFTAHVGSITEIFFMVSFIPFLIYFMLSWQEHVRTQTVMLFDMEHRSTAYVTVGLISSMIRSYIVGNVLVGLFMGVISTVIFGFLGLPYFYFLGFISGFLSLVPYLGVLLATVPPVAAGLGTLHSSQFIIIVVTVLALHLFGLNVLYPKFLGSRLKLNPLAVTLALLFWGWLWGAMGLVLAIPITGALKIIFDHVDPLRSYAAWLGE